MTVMSPWIPDRGLRGRKGFTLLEMMISLMILAIAMTSVFRLQSMSAMMASQTRFETTAPLLAQMKMAEIMALDSDALGSDSGDFGDEFPEYTWNVSVEEMESDILGTTAERLRRIDLSVIWGGDSYSYDIWAYRMLEPKT